MRYGYGLLCIALLGVIPVLTSAHEVADAVVVHMTENGFEPENVEIEQGDTVIFENIDTRERWLASNIHPTHRAYPGSDINACGTERESFIFDSCTGILPGESFEFTFHQAGEWRFHDHLQPNYTGSITVAEVEGYELPKEPNPDGSVFNRGWNNLKTLFIRMYFRIFPWNLDEKLEAIDFFEEAENMPVLMRWVSLAGPEKVMQRILEESGGGEDIDCHQPAHQIGRASYLVLGAEVFEHGDASCHSGYYHGAMESFLAEKGTKNLAENITELCSIFETRFGIFECLHGVGHGVMAYQDYDLPEALDDCGKLATPFDQRSCYGGVFMENIIAAQGLGAIPGHDTEWIRQDDPHFPCNAVGDDTNVRFECYQMQTSMMLWLNGYDFEKTAKQCEYAGDMKLTCYRSLGRDIAGYTLRDPIKMRSMCDPIPRPDPYLECIRGAVNVVIDFWGPRLENQAKDFCFILQDEDTKNFCYSVEGGRRQEIFGEGNTS